MENRLVSFHTLFVKVRFRAAGWAWLPAVLCLWVGQAHAETRFAATNADTLEITSAVDNDLVERWRDALDRYRQDLRQGLQVASRPLSQQSAEMQILAEHLRSAGYYNHDIQPRPEEDYNRLRYRVDPGRRFVVRQIIWDWPEELTTPLNAEDTIQTGEPLVAQNILDLQTRLRREIQSSACYLRVNVRYELSLDRRGNAGDLRFYMEDSPQVNISEVRIEGTEEVRSSYTRRLTGIEDGECFQRPRLDRARLNLYESNLFARVDEQVSEPDENNEVVVTYHVQERFHRTLKLGGGYDTDAGPGVNAEWVHRNFSRRGERLVLDARTSFLTQRVGAALTIPRRRPEWPRLTVSTSLERTLFADQRTYVWQKGFNLEQILTDSWVGNSGVDVRSSWTTTEEGVVDFEQWLALPTNVVRDTRDDVLDPRRGTRLLFGFTPNFSLSGTQPHYGQVRASWRGYWAQTDSLTLAATTEGSTLFGLGDELDLDRLSVTERLYAGGGGSVRGWPFQGVSPTDGGRTRVLQSVEQRVRWSERWGTVGFVDAAWLSRSATLDWDDPALGAGLGLRFFTDFAPLRIDVGSPLPDWGSEWRFYFSIGQAF
ncbi:MAG: BamA/TamA family outer membrane protein [Natronospirillum sp.]|uniref:autotransporter assembly complex protein TamA n=1 Tax=Natronospirillum sp. TaxID=2812955 RepID=UPI0025FE4476|nr:BamA/TamA family outer membrane protein [Natronospirillum sp.]MCH8550778.1 BamA/TamA family outer membrane protein [Natronospirillum sp.]